MSRFLHNTDDDNAKVIAIHWVFSKNSRAKNLDDKAKNVFQNGKRFQTIVSISPLALEDMIPNSC